MLVNKMINLTKKYLLVCFVLILSFGFVSCSDNKDNANENVITYKVTFLQADKQAMIFDVISGESFNEDKPKLLQIPGYICTWEDIDTSCITHDITIRELRTPIIYKINYFLPSKIIIEIQEVSYNSSFKLLSKISDGELWFWLDDATNKKFEYNGKYQYTNDINLIAVFVNDINSDIGWSDNYL